MIRGRDGIRAWKFPVIHGLSPRIHDRMQVGINQPAGAGHHFDGIEKRRTRCVFSIADKSSARETQCSSAYVRAMDDIRSLRCLSLSPFHRTYRCIVDASCVMTPNDRECVNPECGTGAAIGRSESGSASGLNQSGSYFDARDRRCKRTFDLENGTLDQVWREHCEESEHATI